MLPVKILIAEDHTMMAQLWGAFLSQRKDYEVVEKVGSCKALMEALSVMKTDVVLLDLALSDGSALDITSKIKSISPNIKLLAISGYTDLLSVKRAFMMGVDGYLTKTSTLEELDKAIKSVMAGQVYQSEEVQLLLSDDTSEKESVRLTKKEKQVAYLVYKGLSAKAIAERLGVSFKTVEVHRHHIYQKLGIQKASMLIWHVKDNQHLFADVDV
jgi:DNA-binding NarL/FixJ family response regulator